MKLPTDLPTACACHGIRLSVERGQLVLESDRTPPEELVEAIKAHREALMRWVQAQAAPQCLRSEYESDFEELWGKDAAPWMLWFWFDYLADPNNYAHPETYNEVKVIRDLIIDHEAKAVLLVKAIFISSKQDVSQLHYH